MAGTNKQLRSLLHLPGGSTYPGCQTSGHTGSLPRWRHEKFSGVEGGVPRHGRERMGLAMPWMRGGGDGERSGWATPLGGGVVPGRDGINDVVAGR